MKSILLAGAALLAFGAGVADVAAAQAIPASQQPPVTDTPPPPPPGADPNAGQPTGAVPPETGMQPAPSGVPKDPSAPVGTASNPVTVGGNVTPPPTEAKSYPMCSKTVQDSCINPSEAPRSMHKRPMRKHR